MERLYIVLLMCYFSLPAMENSNSDPIIRQIMQTFGSEREIERGDALTRLRCVKSSVEQIDSFQELFKLYRASDRLASEHWLKKRAELLEAQKHGDKAQIAQLSEEVKKLEEDLIFIARTMNELLLDLADPS